MEPYIGSDTVATKLNVLLRDPPRDVAVD